MTDWVLLNGAVTLNAMGRWAFWRIVLVTPVTMILTYLMVPSRFSKNRSKRMLPALYGVLWVIFLLAHLTVLPRTLSDILGQMVKGLLEYVAFPLYYSKYRDWRTVFLMLTGGVFCLQANSIGRLLLGRSGSVAAVNLVVALATLLLLGCFVRCQRQIIWSHMECQDTGWLILRWSVGRCCCFGRTRTLSRTKFKTPSVWCWCCCYSRWSTGSSSML